MRENIKNLPEDRNYFTEIGHSQNYPWVEIKRTPKTVTLAQVEVKRDEEWIPEFSPGGFAAYCINQRDQTWLMDYIQFEITKTIYWTKKGWSRKGTRFVEGVANYYYDYNF